MKLLSRARVVLPCLTLTAALSAGTPLALKPGTELVLTPAGGPANVVLRQGHFAFNTTTTLTVTPDPLGESTSRQWVLPAGSEISLTPAPGLTLRRLDLAQSIALEIDAISPDPGSGNKYPPTFAPKATVAPDATSLSMDPDPGQGQKYPPT